MGRAAMGQRSPAGRMLVPGLPFGFVLTGRDGRVLLRAGRGAALPADAAAPPVDASDLAASDAAARAGRPALATTDAFHLAVARELELVRRGGPVGCVALLDVDDLKHLNGVHGYAVGDRILRGIGEVLGSVLRAPDLTARVDGDEFAVLLPQTTTDEASDTVVRLCQRIGAEIPVPGGGRLTVSAGIAALSTGPATPGTVLSSARAAAFAAKARDRGSVIVAGRGLFEELRRERRELHVAATVDERTGLPNARSYASDVAVVHLDAQHDGTTYGLVLIDIDHFHAYNRDHGQLAGHETLRRVGQRIAEVAAPARAYRYGGEEFTVLVPAPATADQVDVLGERIVAAVRDLGLVHDGRPDATAVVTVTAAGTVGPVGADVERRSTTSSDAAFERVDRGLVAGKDAGRDRYVAMHEQLA
jgi:diguanylate cyclase (GGDEF)-like protein